MGPIIGIDASVSLKTDDLSSRKLANHKGWVDILTMAGVLRVLF